MIKIDIVTYALAKKFALRVSAGFSAVTVDNNTSTINFTLNDGSTASLTVPKPKDGVSVNNIYVDANNHLIFEMSDSTSFDAGAVPEQQISISAKEGNGLKKEADGLYVSQTGVSISPKENNALQNLTDGLYVPTASAQENEIMSVVESNMETEDLDFSSLL